MFIIMKRFKWFVLIAFFPMAYLNAQNCDIHFRDMINRNEWFTLDKEYALRKDSIKAPELRLWAKSLLNTYFNRPDSAINSIGCLLANYEDKIGFYNVVGMFRYKLSQLAVQRRYNVILEELDKFLNKFSAHLSLEDLNLFRDMQKDYKALRAAKSPKIVKLYRNIEIPFGTLNINFTITKEDKNVEHSNALIGLVKVKIHGKTYVFVLDTGSETTCIFDHTAKQLGLCYLQDSINLLGVKKAFGMAAMLDSLSLSGLSISDLMITIEDNPFLKMADSQSQKADIEQHLHGILGLDIIRRLGELQLYPYDRKIVIPAKETDLPEAGRNMFMSVNNYLVIRAYNKSRSMAFHLDTGSTDSKLFKSYYLKNKIEIDGKLKKMNEFSGGIGGSKTNCVYLMPSLNLTVGLTSFSLNNLSINTQNPYAIEFPTDGSLGMDFIMSFNKITLNMNKMFIVLEK